jgi:hypothetical protein
MAAFGLKALHPSSTATDDKPHIIGFSTPRSTAGLLLLDVWNGSSTAARKFSIDKDGHLAVKGNIIVSTTDTLIAPDTSDAADTKAVHIAGGGAATSTRGAYISAYGNEGGGTGDLYLSAGNVVGAEINFLSGGSNSGYFTANGVLTLGTGGVDTGAARGDLVVKNTLGIRAVNAAANNTYALIGGNASDQVVLAGGTTDIKWGKAEIALGGGSSATLGTVAGSGPSTATQNGWLKVINSDGQSRFIPTWA